MSYNRGSGNVSTFYSLTKNSKEDRFWKGHHNTSAFHPLKNCTSVPAIFDYTDIAPQTQFVMGSSAAVKYRLDINDSQVIDQAVWMGIFNPLTGTNPRWCDSLGPLSVKKCTMRFNTKIVQEFSGEGYLFSSQRTLDRKAYKSHAVVERRDVPVVTRTSDATAVQEVGCYLDPLWFHHSTGNSWQQWMHSTGADTVTIEVVTRDPEEMLQDTVDVKPGYTGDDYLRETFIRFRIWAIPVEMRTAITDAFWTEHGHEYNTLHEEYYTKAVAAADTSVALDLRQITGHISYSCAVIRPDANLTGKTYTNNDRTQVLGWTSRKLETNGKDFIQDHTARQIEEDENYTFYPGETGWNSVMVTHSPHPGSPEIMDTGIDYSMASSPKEYIYFGAYGAAHTVDYWAFARQIIDFLPKRENPETSWLLHARYFF